MVGLMCSFHHLVKCVSDFGQCSHVLVFFMNRFVGIHTRVYGWFVPKVDCITSFINKHPQTKRTEVVDHKVTSCDGDDIASCASPLKHGYHNTCMARPCNYCHSHYHIIDPGNLRAISTYCDAAHCAKITRTYLAVDMRLASNQASFIKDTILLQHGLTAHSNIIMLQCIPPQTPSASGCPTYTLGQS